ncbi:MAG: DUF2065 family protein [Betaproteobacteria bacterium]|nr:DUF2065 family protein [Betaproteobacteria bacterium]
MTLDAWLAAFGLLLLAEGALPFLLPSAWRRYARMLSELEDGQIRFIGLAALLSGLLILLLAA